MLGWWVERWRKSCVDRQQMDRELGEWVHGEVNSGRRNGETMKSWADGCPKNSELALCGEALRPSGKGSDSHIRQESDR